MAKEGAPTKVKINIQDQFLNQLRKERAKIKVELSTGREIEGFIKSFDNFTVVIEEEDKFHLIYKHAVASIIIDKSIRLNFYHQQQEREY